jgi:catechol 2,3-dioxygenase-like lactoylglutathione lyase family enzyme
MKVKRIVANIATEDVAKAKRFYQGILGLDVLMDHGWLVAYGSAEKMTVQVGFATEGGSGTPVPDLSIEVDDVEEALRRMKEAKIRIEYGPADEPWSVRRFFVRDPFGKLVNILMHT